MSENQMAPVQDPNTLTEADYDLNPAVLLQSMGVNPNTVKADSFSLRVLERKVIVEYTVMRAVTPKMLGIAMLRSAQPDEPTEPEAPSPAEDPSVPPTQPGTPIHAVPTPEPVPVPHTPQQFPALVPEEQVGERQP